MGNSNSGILGTLFSLIFKRNRNNSLSAMTDQPESKPAPHTQHTHSVGLSFTTLMLGGHLDEAMVERIEQVIVHSGNRLNPEMVQQLLNSEQFRERLDPAAQQRIRAALARATGQPVPDASPAALTQEPTASQSPSSPNAWQPDARTKGDANWQPDGVIQDEDPWHPGGKTDDPWHPDSGAKKNDPWHPGD